MKRKTGYLANLINVPPLIFRFQFNPELMSEKKSFEYVESNAQASWKFDKTKEEKGFLGKAGGVLDDIREFGSLLSGTKAQHAVTGKPRTFALDFALDARSQPGLPDAERARGGPLISGDEREEGRLEPSLAVLRSFMNPTLDPVADVLGLFAGGKDYVWLTRPPTCNLKLGGLDLDCVVNDLNIKTTHFKPDLTPLRAEVSITLTEQTHSVATTLDYLARQVEVLKSYAELESEDWVQTAPGAAMVQNVFESGA